MAVTGWKLDEQDRATLLQRFAPTWPDVIADHVTLDARATSSTPLPDEVSAEIIGTVDDGAGLQAMIIAINGSTDRPDGSSYHITWSLDRAQGRQPVQSNDVIARLGWRAFADAVPIRLIPARFG